MEGEDVDGCMMSKINQDDDDIETEAVSSSQPATQPLYALQDIESEEEEEEEASEIWGFLFPLHRTLKIEPLTYQMLDSKKYKTEGQIKVGRASDNDIVITDDQLPKKNINNISRLQFIIERKKDGTVDIQDKSSNGTFIDDLKIGRGKKKALIHNSEIKMAETPAYIFMSTNRCYHLGYPSDLTERYMVSKKLGSGASGTVFLAFSRVNGQKLALKCIEKKKMYTIGKPDLLAREVSLTKKANHPNVIRLHEIFETNETLYLVLEYAAGGELFDKIVEETRFPEPVAKIYFMQALYAVEYLHSINITHRDLKPENVLVGDNVEDIPSNGSDIEAKHHRIIKIADMGLSKENVNTKLESFVGTPQYIAPEIIVGKVRHQAYTNKVDMWSLGVILYILLRGRQPFRPDRDDRKDLAKQILDCDFSLTDGVWDKISSEAKELIQKLLVYDPNKRLSASEALKHPWLCDEEIKEKVKKILDSEGSSYPELPIAQVEAGYLEPPLTQVVPPPRFELSQKRPHSPTSETEEIEFSTENKAMNPFTVPPPCKKQK